MLHAEVVTHFMGNSCGHEAHRVAVIHVDAPRVLIGADGALQRLAHYSCIKLLPSARGRKEDKLDKGQ